MKSTRKAISELAKTYKLPYSYVKRLLEKKVITLPLGLCQRQILDAFSKVWYDSKILRIGLQKHSKSTREALVRTAGLNKIESYIYSRLYNAYSQGQVIYTNFLISELVEYYNLSFTPRQIKKLKRRIYLLRRRAKYAVKSYQKPKT